MESCSANLLSSFFMMKCTTTLLISVTGGRFPRAVREPRSCESHLATLFPLESPPFTSINVVTSTSEEDWAWLHTWIKLF